jgi:3(or 17)beta-hydroxysteroid dehydrogenase
MGRVEGKVAIVTGGAGGIGGASARRFAEEGAKVTVADLNDEAGEKLAADIGADYVSHDVTSEQAWADLVSGVMAKHGGLHILLNAAGIIGDVTASTPENCSLDNWHRIHAVNLDGTFLGCRQCLAPMRDSGGGSIINISSLISYIAAPASVAYGSSKAAVAHLTKSVALHAGNLRPIVRCNSVHPGLIDTGMFDSVVSGIAQRGNMSAEDALENALTRVPFRALGAPKDVADLILFLASDEAHYITGTPIKVDGGWDLD